MGIKSNKIMIQLALLIVYNHRYDKNIERLEAIYKGRFSHIFHLMPFYDGERKNVIPVYESSFHFQGYIAQAYHHIKKLGFTHYFIIADDMVINPIINENNIFEKTGIGDHQSYIYDIREIHNCFVPQHVNQMRKYRIKVKGVEAENILPSKQDAEKFFEEHNLSTQPLTTSYLLKAACYAFKARMLRKTLAFLKDAIIQNRKITYPLVWGYSDILLLPADVMEVFTTYCGTFAATGLFVEYAIPTSLVFAAKEIITDKSLNLHGVTQVYSKKRLKQLGKINAFNGYTPLYWEEESLEERYHFSLHELIDNFPKNIFFIHPIKLSRWR